MHFFLYIIFLSSFLYAGKSITSDIVCKSRYIFDKNDDHIKKPKKFRVSKDLKDVQDKNLNLKGYKELNISGSSQFSEKEWIFIKNYLQQTYSINQSDIYVIDLREEPHFFINGLPITMAVDDLGKEDILKFEAFIDIDKDNMQLFEQDLVLETEKKKSLDIYKVIDKKEKIFSKKYKKQHTTIKSIQTERDLIQKLGSHYIRFSVTDHKRPTDQLIDQFLDFLKNLPENSWLHFHCRGGVGRTSSFMLMIDIIKNGKDMPLDHLIQRNVEAGGSTKLFELDKLGASKFKDGLVRRDFLVSFYKYVKDPNGYGVTSWSKWIQDQKK
jgi:hypothetical protein